MEANAPYALYDNDGSRPMQWAAHIRLTPELLLKLQQAPEQVLLTLATSASGSATRKSSTKTSLLTVDMGARHREHTNDDDDGGDECSTSTSSSVTRYELHAFQEDPRVNYLCAFRRDPSAAPDASGASDTTASPSGARARDGGYSIYTAGRIYQKLIVQRMLDSTEKGRMKDRHAQSVIEARARSSKLLDDATAPTTTATKRRRTSLFSSQPTSRLDAKATASASASAVESPLRRRVLRSALSATAAQETREKIEKGFERAPPAAAAAALPVTLQQQRARASKQSRATEHASLFSSSGSDASDNDEPAPAEATAVSAAIAPAAPSASSSSAPPAEASAEPSVESHDTQKPPVAAVAAPATGAIVDPPAPPTAAARAPAAPAKLPAVRKPLVPSETKRPLPRGTRIPDLAFFPDVVSAICKKIATHIPRSAILDDADYSAFEQQYDGFCADWATLDKAYSIEVINMESVHVRMQLARCDDERAVLEKEREENAKKREALLFVRDAMASVKKVLASLQASIARYDQKLT